MAIIITFEINYILQIIRSKSIHNKLQGKRIHKTNLKDAYKRFLYERNLLIKKSVGFC